MKKIRIIALGLWAMLMIPATAWADSPASGAAQPMPGGYTYLYIAAGCLVLAIILIIYRARKRLNQRTKK